MTVMLEWLRQPWPWYVSGPLIGLFVPVLLWLGNRQLGMTGSLRALCAATLPSRAEFLRYDWRRSGLWNIAIGGGIIVGAAIAAAFLNAAATPPISQAARHSLAALGLSAPAGLVPADIFSLRALLTWRGATCVVGGGFLVGFGSSYAGGCTSGHGVLGLASLQLASLIAVAGIFAGGLITTLLILPRL